MRRLPRPTSRGWVVLGAGLGFIAIGASSGFTDLIRAGVFGVILVGLAALIAIARPRRLSVERSAGPQRLQAGRTYAMNLDLTTPQGVWVDVDLLEQHSFDGSPVPRWSFGRLPRTTTKLTYDVTPTRRGEHSSGPLVVSMTDPLGLVHSDFPHGSRHSWLVWPHLVEVDGFGGRRRGEGEDEIISAHAAQAGHAGASIREYVQGDDIRMVHWAATAHRGELMVRQFDPPAQPMTRLVIQGDVPTPGTDESWEALLSLAASTCRHFERHALPLSVSIGDRHIESATEAIDAIAAVTTSQPDDAGWLSAPTLLFHHTSVPGRLAPPRRQPARALVAGPDTDSAAEDLAALGWVVDILDLTQGPADTLTELLENFGATR